MFFKNYLFALLSTSSMSTNSLVYSRHKSRWLAYSRLSLNLYPMNVFSSVQFSGSVVSNSLRPHESQHSRPSCPSPTPRVHSDSCPSSRWCHPATSSSIVPFSSCPQSLPASGSFPMNQLFAWGGQSIGVSASTSVLAMNTQGWSPLEWTGCLLSFILFFSLSSAYQYFSLFK